LKNFQHSMACFLTSWLEFGCKVHKFQMGAFAFIFSFKTTFQVKKNYYSKDIFHHHLPTQFPHKFSQFLNWHGSKSFLMVPIKILFTLTFSPKPWIWHKPKKIQIIQHPPLRDLRTLALKTLLWLCSLYHNLMYIMEKNFGPCSKAKQT
jgi:hypothetical protein